MILNPVQPAEPDGEAMPRRNEAPASKKRPWRRRRWLLAGVGTLVVLVGIGVVLAAQRATPPPAVPAAPVSVASLAHGQVVPAQQARVGTQGGGVVRQLSVSTGDQVGDRTAVAWVEGPSGMEVLTAPFSGTVSNVLVHAGDTLLPGATLVVVADLRTLQVETSDVDQFIVGHVQAGQVVQVTVDALNNLAVRGTVKSVAALPQTDAVAGQSYPVVIALGSIPPDMRAGMTIRVTFPD